MSTINPQEIEKFANLASDWWDLDGKFAILHRFNPVRLKYIRDTLVAHFKLDENSATPLAKLKILDVGCGGGLVCEPLAKLGAAVTGIDAAQEGIEAAKLHQTNTGSQIDYRAIEASEIVDEKFDVVLALEIIEHVNDVELFIKQLADLVKPGGILMIATINRTLKSLVLAKFAAEYVLRWVPAGTHSFAKFLKPSEIAKEVSRHGLNLKDLQGFAYDVFANYFKKSSNSSINYIITFIK